MLDFNKPIQTRDGRPVTIIATNTTFAARIKLGAYGANHTEEDGDPYPQHTIVASIKDADGGPCIETFTPEGRFLDCSTSNWDLVQAPERTSVFRTFAEKNSPHATGKFLGGGICDTLEEAQALTHTGWEGVVELIREDGKLVDIKFHPND